MWMRKGHQREIFSPGVNRKLHVFGALNFRSGVIDYRVTHQKPQWQFETFLLHLFDEVYPEQYLVLVLDHARDHTTPVILDLLAYSQERVFVLWLPKYSPKLNPIERFWGAMKGIVFDNYYFGDANTMEQAVHEFFNIHNSNPKDLNRTLLRLSKNLS